VNKQILINAKLQFGKRGQKGGEVAISKKKKKEERRIIIIRR
jgi:hypothetical protein